MKTVNLTEEEHAELLAKRAKNPTRASAPAASDVVRAAGTSEGAKKGWETRAGASPRDQRHALFNIEDQDNSRVTMIHKQSGRQERMSPRDARHALFHIEPHDEGSPWHIKVEGDVPRGSEKYAEPNKASSATQTDIIHCRSHASAAGSVLAAEKAWNAGEPVEFMWMPAGKHTICAGFRNGSIELTVNCDEKTAANVQASLDAWRTERPKQEPFGCVEHREHEASVRVSAQQAFSFKNDGVYIAAEPTALGAQNVNGKVHRSWSPSFTTDADYSAAKTIKTASGATVMVFPEGVRGSRSNPAEITGVDFCVGTLTNKPAFHAMSPVKSSESASTLVTLHDGTQFLYENGELVAETNVTVEKTVTATDSVKATWSDAARVAAAHARELSRLAHEEPLKRSTDGKPRADAEAYGVTKQAHSASKKTKQSEIDGNGAGIHMDSHNYAAYMHTEAAKAHKKAGDSFMSELHTKAAAAHREATSELWKENNKASDSTKGDEVHAHCAHILLQDVPDATAAEIACYDKCIDEGGSHITAVTEIKSQRKPEHVTQKASDKVNAAWSDAARQAAAEARKNHVGKCGITHIAATLEKGKRSAKMMAVIGGGGDVNEAADHLEDSGHEIHQVIAGDVNTHPAVIFTPKSVNASSDELTPDSIYATLEQRIEAANSVAKSKGVISVEDVYEKVTAAGNSEGVKKAWESRRAKVGDRVKISDGSGLDSGKEGVVVHHREVKTDGRGIPTNVSGAYKPIDHSKEHVIRTDDGKLITMFHNRVLVAKASDATSSAPIQATWSDAARKAAAATRQRTAAQKVKISLHEAGNAESVIGDHLADTLGEHSFQTTGYRNHPSGKSGHYVAHLEDDNKRKASIEFKVHRGEEGEEDLGVEALGHTFKIHSKPQGGLTDSEKKSAEAMAERSDHANSQDFHDSLNEHDAWEGSGIPEHKREAALNHAVAHHAKINGSEREITLESIYARAGANR